MRMTIDYVAGPKGNNGNSNGNGNGNGPANCHVVPPGFIPPGLAKKCGQVDEEYPDMHPGGPRRLGEAAQEEALGAELHQ
ncbi:hypothetical protein [Paenibacillus chungangensis]|uniref:Uncharacterized protein n=1 Tax=Paenibacillus chungangensis TaxID=696535 RepID=A0ABW3HNQ2_9BACL